MAHLVDAHGTQSANFCSIVWCDAFMCKFHMLCIFPGGQRQEGCLYLNSKDRKYICCSRCWVKYEGLLIPPSLLKYREASDQLLIHKHHTPNSWVSFPDPSFFHLPRDSACSLIIPASLCLHGDLSPRIHPLWQQLLAGELRVMLMMRCDSKKSIFSSSAR